MARQLVIRQQNGCSLIFRLTGGNNLECVQQSPLGAWSAPFGVGGATTWADLTYAQLSGTIGGGGLANRIELFGFNAFGQILVIAQVSANGGWPAAPQNLG